MVDETIPIRRPSVSIPNFVVANDASTKKETPKYPSEVIPLPTKGWFYPVGHPLSSGEVEVKQMTAREEDILANQDLIKRGKVLDKLIESLLIDKTIKSEEILVPDKNAIFIAIRRLAYGDEYPVSVACPKCDASNKVSINLSSFENKPFDFNSVTRGVNSFALTLPSGTEITYKILCQLDELSIDAEISQLKKISKESKDLSTRLKYLLTSVNGNPDKSVIRKFVENELTAKDSLEFRKHMRKTNPDIDMSFDFSCDECEHERRMDVPIGASFLWPDFDSRG